MPEKKQSKPFLIEASKKKICIELLNVEGKMNIIIRVLVIFMFTSGLVQAMESASLMAVPGRPTQLPTVWQTIMFSQLP